MKLILFRFAYLGEFNLYIKYTIHYIVNVKYSSYKNELQHHMRYLVISGAFTKLWWRYVEKD